jgi:hypothetical protein
MECSGPGTGSQVISALFVICVVGYVLIIRDI